jgi:hypothetical protein
MSRDFATYQRYLRWFADRQRRVEAWKRLLQARRYAPIRRTGPAPQWHPDQHTQPGEVE